MIKAKFLGTVTEMLPKGRIVITLFREQEISIIPQIGSEIVFENEEGDNGYIIIIDRVIQWITCDGNVSRIAVSQEDFKITERDCFVKKNPKEIRELLEENPKLLPPCFKGWQVDEIKIYDF